MSADANNYRPFNVTSRDLAVNRECECCGAQGVDVKLVRKGRRTRSLCSDCS